MATWTVTCVAFIHSTNSKVRRVGQGDICTGHRAKALTNSILLTLLHKPPQEVDIIVFTL